AVSRLWRFHNTRSDGPKRSQAVIQTPRVRAAILHSGFLHSVEAMHRTRRKRLSSICLASCAASLLLAAPTQATEYGFGDYGLGYGIPMSGYTPPPGVYFSDSFYLYSASASKNL